MYFQGTAVGIGMDGAIDWYRLDNWGQASGTGTGSSGQLLNCHNEILRINDLLVFDLMS